MTCEAERLVSVYANVPLFKSSTGRWSGVSRPLLSVVFCSLFSEILRIAPHSEDKCANMLLNHLRDLQALTTTSYIDDPTNLADTETKHAGSRPIIARFLIAGKFSMSFVRSGAGWGGPIREVRSAQRETDRKTGRQYNGRQGISFLRNTP